MVGSGKWLLLSEVGYAHTGSTGLFASLLVENQISLKVLHLPYNSIRKVGSHIYMLQESL